MFLNAKFQRKISRRSEMNKKIRELLKKRGDMDWPQLSRRSKIRKRKLVEKMQKKSNEIMTLNSWENQKVQETFYFTLLYMWVITKFWMQDAGQGESSICIKRLRYLAQVFSPFNCISVKVFGIFLICFNNTLFNFLDCSWSCLLNPSYC